MHIHVSDEVSMTTYMNRRAYKRKLPKCLPLKTTSQNHKIFYVHIWGTYVHMCTKYKVSMSNPVPGGGVHR